jgi:hypothetical protein
MDNEDQSQVTPSPEELADQFIGQCALFDNEKLVARSAFVAGYSIARADHDMSYRQGYLDGMIDSQAKATKLESFMKGFEKGIKQLRASNPPKEEK